MKNLETTGLISEIFGKLEHITKVIDDITVKTEKLDELLDELMDKSQDTKKLDELMEKKQAELLDYITASERNQDELKEKNQGPTVFEIAAEEKSKIIKTDKYWFYRGYAIKLKDGMPYDERFGGYLSDEDVVYAVDDEINKLNDIYDDGLEAERARQQKPIEIQENNDIIIDLTAIANRKRKNKKNERLLDMNDIKLEEE